MTERSRRGALIGGGMIIGLWLTFKAGPAVVGSIRESRWQLADQVRLLEQSRREIDRERMILDSAMVLKNAILALGPRLLSGKTVAEAVDALNGLINLAADRANAKVTGFSPETDSVTAGGLRRAVARVAVDCDVRGLTAMLRGLAGEEIVLSTDGFQVVAAEPGGSGSGPEVLRVEMRVRGWYLSEE
jgi:hypothetical protein